MNEQQIFFAFIFGTLILTVFTLSLGLFLIGHKRKQRQNRLEKQQLAITYKNELLQARLEEQEKSMKLISEEVHDNIGQVLGLTKMYLHNVMTHVHTEEGKNFGNIASDFLTQAINDLRHISHSLNSELLEAVGLDNCLEREITFLQETVAIYCSFQVNGTPCKFEKERSVIIFRIVQEALQNAVKHSQATHLELILNYSTNRLDIIVKDNGIGFNIDSARQSNSLGLRNIRNRADLLGAHLDIITHPGKGTEILVSIPCNSTKP